MIKLRMLWLSLIGASLLLLAGCGGNQISDADQVATRVAQDRAVAQTLTAEAAGAAPSTTSEAPTSLPPSSTALPPTAPPATALPSPTQAPSTATPAPLQPLTPTPTEEQELLAVFAPGGTANGLEGRVTVIGGASYDKDTRIVPVSGRFGIRIEARDPDVGSSDGAGITRVIYRITDLGSGNQVYEHTENNPPYCLFNDPNDQCFGIALGQDATWPDGTPMTPGQHFVDVEIQADNSDRNENWNFIVDLQLP